MAAQSTVTAGGSLLIFAATGALGALVAPAVIDGPDVAVHAFTYMIGQWPATLAVTGWTALLVGLRLRLGWLAWVPLFVGATFALLGIPQHGRDFGVFQHMPDVVAPNPDFRAQLVLIAFAGGALLIDLAGASRRDATAG
ncbi:hypothetical protein Amsp01_041710 [Amycolatopsis sp. NBRC 101858]|uniref:hypothetical protein n=1 Tax=Amycolatopsis sp. NBRC 101858 TaxID=3032200 RepID=UPI0024A2F2BD|nr:hypothetical protein [Amycolatopsis sp. NBRC 101858]GLY38147.1 hypothetical protein Amsp01_041710 [Amycolatopsis sp. NBRC 101858]